MQSIRATQHTSAPQWLSLCTATAVLDVTPLAGSQKKASPCWHVQIRSMPRGRGCHSSTLYGVVEWSILWYPMPIFKRYFTNSKQYIAALDTRVSFGPSANQFRRGAAASSGMADGTRRSGLGLPFAPGTSLCGNWSRDIHQRGQQNEENTF